MFRFEKHYGFPHSCKIFQIKVSLSCSYWVLIPHTDAQIVNRHDIIETFENFKGYTESNDSKII